MASTPRLALTNPDLPLVSESAIEDPRNDAGWRSVYSNQSGSQKAVVFLFRKPPPLDLGGSSIDGVDDVHAAVTAFTGAVDLAAEQVPHQERKADMAA